METLTKVQSAVPANQGLKLRSNGIRPESSGGLEAWQKQHGKFGAYPVSHVADVGEYITRTWKKGIIHIDPEGSKHPWSLGQLSAAADEGKCIFVDSTGRPVEVGQPYEAIVLPEKMGRNEGGVMLT